MKRTILIILIVVVLGSLIWYGRKLILLKNRVQVQDVTIDFEKSKLLSLDTLRNVPFLAVITLSNYSNDKQTISQMFVELYDQKESKLIAKQSEPLQNKVTLEPNKNTDVSIRSQISTSLLLELAELTNANDLFTLITGGKLGIPLTAKGFAVVNGIKIPFSKEIEI